MSIALLSSLHVCHSLKTFLLTSSTHFIFLLITPPLKHTRGFDYYYKKSSQISPQIFREQKKKKIPVYSPVSDLTSPYPLLLLLSTRRKAAGPSQQSHYCINGSHARERESASERATITKHLKHNKHINTALFSLIYSA